MKKLPHIVQYGQVKAAELAHSVPRRPKLPAKFRRGGLLALAMLCGAGYANQAKAQLIEQYFPDELPGYSPDFASSVLNRMYVQQTSPGIQAGGYVIRPEISEDGGYDSNTLGKAGSGSGVLETRASVEIAPDWERNALSLGFDVDNNKYFDVPGASYTNWQANAQGSVSLGNDSLKYYYSHSGFNLAATDLGVAGITTPVGYTVDDARLAYVKLFSRFSLTPAFEFENFAFGHSGGKASVSYASITHHSEFESIAGRYEVTSGNAAIVVFRASQAQFPNAPDKNFSDFAGLAGIDFKGDSIFQIRALAGIERRKCSCHVENSATVPTYEIAILWLPTELDTINLTGIRRLDDPVSPFALNSKIWDGRISLDHELRADLFLSGSAEVEQSESPLTGPELGDETQTQYSFGTSAVWNFRSDANLSLSYTYNTTSSRGTFAGPSIANGGFPNFHSQTILIGVKFYE